MTIRASSPGRGEVLEGRGKQRSGLEPVWPVVLSQLPPWHTFKVMHAPAAGFPNPPDSDESPAQALVRLLERHGLEDSLKEILAAIQTRKQDGQQRARLALLEHLLEGQPPITEDELAAVRQEWQG